MPEQALHCTMRLTKSAKKLALELAKYHKVRGRGNLFTMYMRDDVDKIKALTLSEKKKK